MLFIFSNRCDSKKIDSIVAIKIISCVISGNFILINKKQITYWYFIFIELRVNNINYNCNIEMNYIAKYWNKARAEHGFVSC